MAKVFITGSSDGLGLMAARILIQQGHQVVLHGRNRERAEAAHVVPKIFFSNGSYEYWGRAAALIHVTADVGIRKAVEPAIDDASEIIVGNVLA